MKYDITVANEGNIDAVLNSIKVSNSNNEAITFETSGIEEGDELKASESDILTVIVTYNSSITSQPENTTATVTVTLDYGQSNDAVTPPTPEGPTVGGITLPLASDGADGLYQDEYESGRYFYKGANPNNYITFNNETWRILSVENDGRIKIVRNELLPARAWDTGGSLVSNSWDRPADINTYLNGEYLETITTNQDKIVPSTWSIGGVTYDSNDLADQIAAENGTQSQPVSVGLITVSECLRGNTNKEQCGSLSLNNDNFSTCKTTNWLFKGTDYWTLSPDAGYSHGVLLVRSYGFLSTDEATYTYAVRPAITLSSDISLSGSGEVEDSFVIN